jgi:hypothetical protein
VAIPTKKAERFACCISRTSGRANNQLIRATRLRFATASHKEQNLPFPFSKKFGGAKKRIKTQRQF